MKRHKKYDSEFDRLFDNARMYATHVFRKRFIPLTDVEDVAIEAAETVLFENGRGGFRSAKNRRHRWELQKNRLEELVRNAARERRTQKAMVSLNAFDDHNRLTQTSDGEGGDAEAASAWLAERERIVNDLGTGAAHVRNFATDGQPPRWLTFFAYAENMVRHGFGSGKEDEREELKRIKRKAGLPAARPKKLPRKRRHRASAALRHDFAPALFIYHMESAAKRR